MKKGVMWRSVAVLVLLASAGPRVAHSGGPEKNPSSPWYLYDADRWWHVDVLVGVESEPDYVGSDDNETEPTGFVRALFKDRIGNRYTVSFDEVGAAFYFGERWALTIDLEDEEGRETENADLAELPDGEETLEGELALFRRFGDGYAFAVYQPDLLGRGKGVVYFLGYGYDHLTASGRWLISPKVDVSFADREHMQTEFGLTVEQAALIGQPSYEARGGLKSVTAGLQVQRFFARRWSLLAAVEAEHYFSEAADSPLIATLGTDLTFEATLGVFYRF